MPTKEQVKQSICDAIDRHRQEIVQLGETILHNPETGYKEHKTAQLVAQRMEELGLAPQTGLALTGVKGRLKGGKPGPTIAILGELDSLIVKDHPLAHQDTGAAHACGHNAQIAGMLGAARGLKEAGALEHLAGEVVFFAVPAEELIEVEERMRMRDEKKIEFMVGKQELIKLGHFDDIHLAIMIHTISDPGVTSRIVDSSNGCVVKKIRFLGKAAHAGGAPQKGINALNAAMLALQAIHMQRETFYDDDTIRIHPIITKGGDAVSVVPQEVIIETYVRGKTLEGITDANAKVDRCLRGAAMAIGCQVEIQTLPGFLPQVNNAQMGDAFEANAETLFGAGKVLRGGHRTGSTDMGDVEHILPGVHPYVRGATGVGHGKDWMIADQTDAYLSPAKLLAMTAVDMLWEDAGAAKQVIAENPPKMTKDEYLAFQRGLGGTERYSGAQAAAGGDSD